MFSIVLDSFHIIDDDPLNKSATGKGSLRYFLCDRLLDSLHEYEPLLAVRGRDFLECRKLGGDIFLCNKVTLGLITFFSHL